MVRLEKRLQYPALLLMAVGSALGTGIFLLISLSEGYAGTTSLLPWFLMAIVSMGVSLILAELVGMYPRAGGVSAFCTEAFGTIPGFLVGWMLLIAGDLALALLVIGAVGYMGPALPQAAQLLISVGCILLLQYVAYRGVRASAVMLVASGVVTFCALFALVLPGISSFSVANLSPFWAHPFSTMPFLILLAASFLGWGSASFLAEETVDAERVLPRVFWLSTLVADALLLCLVAVILGKDVSGGSMIVDFAQRSSDPNGIVSLIISLGLIGAVAGWIVGSPRLIMSLAKERLFFPQLADIHPTHKTPYKAILFQAILCSIFLFVTGSAAATLNVLVPLAFLLSLTLIVTFIVLRMKCAKHPRPFRVWAGIPLATLLVLSLVGIAAHWLLLVPSALHASAIALCLLALGIPVFFLLMFYVNPDEIIRFLEGFAHLNLWFESIVLPKRVRKEILLALPALRGKRVLDFGAGVGTLTKHLTFHVGENGHIIATDLSKKNLEILERRLAKLKRNNVTLIHDPQLTRRVHPDVPFIDVVVSVGMIAYVQDLRRILQEMHRLLPEGGTVCFVEFIDYLWFLPNAGYLKDEQRLLELFQETGFRVELVKMKGVFWKYLFIYGQKSKHRGAYV